MRKRLPGRLPSSTFLLELWPPRCCWSPRRVRAQAHAQTPRRATAKKPAAKSPKSRRRETARRPPRLPATDRWKNNWRSSRAPSAISPNATAYSALSAFASRNAKNEVGARAALALGYYDLTRDKPELALGWLRKAVGEKLLREYVQYWQAQTSLALGQKEEALEQFQSILRDFPDGAMTDQTVTALAQTALAVGKGEDALAALNAYPNTRAKPALLLLRAQAREKVARGKGRKTSGRGRGLSGPLLPLSIERRSQGRGQEFRSLQSALGESFPGVPLQTQIARAEAFYTARRWRDASTEFAALLPKLSGVDHQRADLRIVQCEVETGGKLGQLSAISLTDPELDAERIYSIAQAAPRIKTRTADAR